MTEVIPNLELLRAFEAAGRYGSFKAAAEELHLTPSAISHRVARLETLLHEPLFEPHGRGVAMTPLGRTFLQSVQATLADLHAAIDRVRRQGTYGPLTVSLHPTFAQRWLIPRLPRFAALHPEINIHLVDAIGPVDLTSAETDAAIGYGMGDWTGVRSEVLLAERVVPVCNPSILRSISGPVDPAALLEMNLIHCSQKPEEWIWWLERSSVAHDQFTHISERGHWMATREFAMAAATAGLGVALGHSPLMDDDIRNGRLVAPVEVFQKTPNAYHLVTTEAKLSLPRVIAFRDWLREEVQMAHQDAPEEIID